MSNATGTYFGTLLRHWREVRRMIQLELFLEAHLSTAEAVLPIIFRH